MTPLHWITKVRKASLREIARELFDKESMQGRLSRAVNGLERPSFKMMRRFYEASAGKVRDVDWFKLYPED